jgi:hypothetical protein
MKGWQYAQLRVRYDSRAAEGQWTILWHGPDGSREDTAGLYDEVVVALNRAGTDGWELVDVAALDAGDNRQFLSSAAGDWSITKYTFRRPHDPAVATSTGPIQQRAPIRVAPLGSGQPARSQVAGPAGAAAADPVTLVRMTAFWLPDSERAGIVFEVLGLGAGRVLIRREVAPVRDQADLDEIESLRAEYQDPGVSVDRREQIAAAAADYAASLVEGQLGVTWWRTSPSLPLSQAADLLNGSADWLRGLVEHPLAAAASTAGAAGPIVPIGAGITANYVTAPLTMPLGDAARVCEIAGIVIGLATGAHPLVMACAKRLAHDEAGRMLSRAFEQVSTSIDAGHDSPADADRDTRIQRPEPPQPAAPAGRTPDPRGIRGGANDPETQRERERLALGETLPSAPRTQGPAKPWETPPPRPQPPGPPGPQPPGPAGPGAPGM